MVDISAVENLLLQSQNFMVLGAPGPSPAGAADRLVTLTFADLEEDVPEDRRNHGTKRVYLHGAPDLAFFFTANTSTDLLTYLAARFSRSDRNVATRYKWRIQAVPSVGTAQMIEFTGVLIRKRLSATVENQTDLASVECRIRITDDSITIT